MWELYCYDVAGNVLDDGVYPAAGLVHKYSYDGEGRMVSSEYGQTGYTYDAEGNRVGATASGGTVRNTVFDDVGVSLYT